MEAVKVDRTKLDNYVTRENPFTEVDAKKYWDSKMGITFEFSGRSKTFAQILKNRFN